MKLATRTVWRTRPWRHGTSLAVSVCLAATASLSGCFDFDETETEPLIRCSQQNTWCPDGFYCNPERWRCRRFECAQSCAADERCVDGVCVQWLGCEASEASGCAGCDCEACVCAFFPECCPDADNPAETHEGWNLHCANRCRICGGCGVTTPEPCRGAACPDLAWTLIGGGEFLMGDDRHDTDEQPVHAVTVARFEMARTEVTVAQYHRCVEAGYCTPPGRGGYCHWGRLGYDAHPLNCVSWFQARTFSEWVGGRLPSEAEWEFAARSGTRSIRDREYPWGNEPPTCDYAVFAEEPSVEMMGCGTESAFPVCSNPTDPGAPPRGTTEQGLCDMAGNVLEWIEDDFHETYDCVANPAVEGCRADSGVAPADGSAWTDPGRGAQRLARGGCWFCNAAGNRTAERSWGPPDQRSDALGFRPVRNVVEIDIGD